MSVKVNNIDDIAFWCLDYEKIMNTLRDIAE